MEKGSAKYSILKGKCPRCNEGELWVTRNPYQLNKFGTMHERCSVCNHKYELEQGFWYGAMYFSYAISVAIGISVVVALTVLTEIGIWGKALSAFIALFFLLPPIFRLSRNIWVNVFTHYEKDWKTKLVKKENQALASPSTDNKNQQ